MTPMQGIAIFDKASFFQNIVARTFTASSGLMKHQVTVFSCNIFINSAFSVASILLVIFCSIKKLNQFGSLLLLKLKGVFQLTFSIIWFCILKT
jgi:hypothetical protein